MPLPSPTVLVNGSAVMNGADVAANSTVTITLASSTGAQSWTVTCTNTDDGQTAAGINAGLVAPISPNGSCTFTAPNAACALIFRSTVGVGSVPGNDNTGLANAALSTTFEIHVKTGNNLRLMAANEVSESNATYGWAKKFNDAAKTAGSALAVQKNGTAVGTRSALNLIEGSAITMTVADNPGSGRVDVTVSAATTAPVVVQHGGTTVGTRSSINLIDGSNVTLTVADNAGSNRVDVTVASSGGGGGGSFPTPGAITYYIDPQNSSGTASDSNNGTSSTTALRTWAKLKTILGTSLADGMRIPIYASTTVIFLSSQSTDTDWVSLQLHLYAPFIVKGTTLAATRSSTMTGGTIARVRTPKASATANIIEDTALATNNGWTVHTNVGEILVDTTAGAAGTACWPQYDLSTDVTAPANKKLRTTEMFDLMNPTAVVPTVTHRTPTSTDAYQTIPLVKVNIASIDVVEDWSVNPDANQNTGPRLTLYRIFGQTSQHFGCSVRADSCLCTMVEMCWSQDIEFACGNNWQIFNSLFMGQVAIHRGTRGFGYGMFMSTGTAEDEPGHIEMHGEWWFLDDCGFGQQNTSAPYTPTLHLAHGSSVYIEVGFSMWSHAGNGIEIHPNATCSLITGSIYGGYGDCKPTVFANVLGTLTYPISATAAASFAVTVTSSNDFDINNNVTAETEYYLASIGSYGVFNTVITCTIANLDTVKASNGFGGSAYWPNTGSRVCQAAAMTD